MEPVADRAEDLTAAWLTDALHSSGHDLVVASVAAERFGTGQMGTTYRLRLTYEGAPGPSTLVAKLAAGDNASRAMVAPGYATEVGFYTQLVASLDVRRPRCWYGAIVDDKTRFTLLLEDLAPATPGVQANGCTVAHARASIRNLVGLHAPRWNDRALRDLDFLPRPSRPMAAMIGEVLATATPRFVERYEQQLSNDDATTLSDVAQVMAEWQLARTETFAVIHGDYRLDNLLFPPSGDAVAAVDWQTAAIGPPLRDVAYFLGTSVQTDDRRANEKGLVAEYHAEIVERGITGYDADQCWDDYRLGQLQGPMVTIIGCAYASGGGSEASDAMFVAMARRSCAAIRDLRSLDLV